MKGRKPKPSNLRRLQGNAGRRALRENEPDPERGIPDPPMWLSSAALDHWREIAPELDALGVLTTVDGLALAMLCEAWADYRQAREILALEGSTYTRMTAAGSTSVVARPEAAISSDAWKRMKSMLIEFGLTPSSRTRVSIRPHQTKSEFEKYLEGQDYDDPN